MRVLSGRLTAVLVASLATVILIGVLAPARHPGQGPARSGALHGRHRPGRIAAATTPPATRRPARTASTRSCRRAGAAWAGRYLGDAEREADARPTRRSSPPPSSGRSTTGWSAWRRVAYWWLTGSSATRGWSPFATPLRDRVMNYYESAEARAPDGQPTPKAKPKPTPAPRPRPSSIGSPRRAGRSRTHGTWKQAGHPRLRRRPVRLRHVGRRVGPVHVHRQPGRLVRPGRPDAWQGARSRSTASASRRSTSIAAPSTRTRPCSARPGRPPASTAWSSRWPGRGAARYVAIDGFAVTD